jgi:hypothetical protein
MDKKRILIAIAFLLLCIGLGYLLWKIFFASPSVPLTPTPPVNTSSSPQGQFPQAGQGNNKGTETDGENTLPTAESIRKSQKDEEQKVPVIQIVTDTIKGASGGKSGAKYYNEQDGKFYKLAADGKPIPLDDKVFFNVENITWAGSKDQGVLEYPDGSNIYYDFETKEQVTLPKHWEDFSFSNNGDKIAAKSIGISEDAQWLITSQNNGKNVKLVESMGANADKVDIIWTPNQEVIATSRTGAALGSDREEILLVGQNHENFKSLEVEGRGFIPSWSPKGNKLLYSVYSERSDFKPELWVVSGKTESIGAERKLLNLNTWANKCTFQDERYVYCGVPEQLNTGAGFVPKTADAIPDKFYKIDTQTGAKTEINIDDSYPHHVDSMFLGEDGKTLFFTDNNYNGLFQIPL